MDGWAFSLATFSWLLTLAQADLLNKRHYVSATANPSSQCPPWSLWPVGGSSCAGSQVVPLKCFT